MSALNKIIKWAQTAIPAWQGDAVRRILISEELSKTDEDELYLLMKSHLKLVDEKTTVPKPVLLPESGFSGAAKECEKIILKSITCVENINAIPNGNELPFGHEGVTIIYGENASGKSGFARLLKRACNARDKRDVVLKNVFNQSFGTPKAKFKIKVGEQDDTFPEWQEGTTSTIPHLTSIAVFDSKCARVIIDEKNEFQYKPYGTHVFEDLVVVTDKLKKRLLAEKPTFEKPVISNLNSSTAGYAFHSNLDSPTSLKSIENYKNFTKEEETELHKLQTFIDDYKKSNIDNKITTLRNIIKKYFGVLKDLRRFEQKLTLKKVQDKVNLIINSLKAAQEAQRIANAAFSINEFPLEGVRTDAWNKLFEAAEKYSKTNAYPDKEYPFVEDGSICVLCMQELDNTAKERMKTFGTFIKDEIGTNLKACANKSDATLKATEKYNFRTDIEYANYLTELAAVNKEMTDALMDSYSQCRNIHDKIKIALEENTLLVLSDYKRYQTKDVFDWLRSLKKEITELESTKVPALLAQRIKDYNELNAKKLIFDQIENIQTYLKNKTASDLIQKSAETIDTRSISNKGREIINEECTPVLQKHLREELDFVSARRLNIQFKSRGSKGVTHHEVELAGAVVNESPSKILSEGEQKAVAIAGFFAELQLSNHQCPIIFDDPVTSLDHKYRDKIAERIAKESTKRQVIVFTHDISFLIDLEKHLGRQGNTNLTVTTLSRHKNQPGHVFSSKPWHAMLVKDRIKYLDNETQFLKQLYNEDQNTYNEKAAAWYGLFRETWEAIIEEVVFNSAIRRFGAEIQTLRVGGVEITDVDYQTIDNNMSKASEWMRGHDKSKGLSIDRPGPEEIKTDLVKTKEFVDIVNKRIEPIRKRRKILLNPQPTIVG
jgi:ABC-type lipoprotein export system ATPase subunit